MKTCKEYRVQASEALKGHYGIAMAVTVIYGLLTRAFSVSIIPSLILSGALLVGFSSAFMQLHRRGTLSFADLFSGFRSENFEATIGLYIKSSIFVFLWSLLFIIPGIVKSYSYSMAPYILADHPEMTGEEAITASRRLMDGRKGRLFCLDLSYIGWILLSILTLGILFLWVEPRMEAAKAAFYEDIKDQVNP